MARGFLRPEAVGTGPGGAFLLPLVGVASGRRSSSGRGRAVQYVVLVASVVVVSCLSCRVVVAVAVAVVVIIAIITLTHTDRRPCV